MKEKILLAEDEEDLATALEMILTYSNYDVTVTYNGKEALEKANTEYFDIIILDMMMPIMTGTEALIEIRKNGIKTPVLFLTARSDIDDKVEVLDNGANDYLTKPFEKKELLARIRALIRNNSTIKYEIGNISFDKEASTITSQTKTFHLSNKECELFTYFVKNKDRCISQVELETEIWKGDEVDDNLTEIYINYLKEKLKALESNITIKNKNGYILEEKL